MGINTKLLIGGGVVAAAIVATPIIYQNQIEKTINTTITNLKEYNVNLTKKDDKSNFFNVKREYILTIKDSTKIIKEAIPNIRPHDLRSLKKAFDGTKFLVTLNITKLPVYHKNAVVVSLLSLNDNAMKDLETSEPGKQLLNFIKNRGIEVLLDVDNLKIAKANLKDIDLTLTNTTYDNKKETMNFVVNNFNINFENDIKTHFNKIAFKFDDQKYSNTLITLNNFNNIYTYKNDFNNKQTTSLQNFSINYNTKYRKQTLNIDNIKVNYNLSHILDNINYSNIISVENFTMSEKRSYRKLPESITIKNFKLGFNLNKISYTNINSIVKKIKENPTYASSLDYSKEAIGIINHGFSFAISPLSVDKIILNTRSIKMDIDPVSVKFSTILQPNKLTLDQLNYNPESAFKYLNATLNIVTTKTNLDLASTMLGADTVNEVMDKIGEIKNNKVIINLTFKNQHLIAKGKQLF